MASSWTKAKRALGLNLCVYPPSVADDEDEGCGGCLMDEAPSSWSASGAALLARTSSSRSGYLGTSEFSVTMPTTPVPSSGGLRICRSGGGFLKQTCTICLGTMKAGQGHALFTAECSHKFHFHCIATNVKCGNYICPVCRAKWKEIPFQAPLSSEHLHERMRDDTNNSPSEESHMTRVRMLPRAATTNRQHQFCIFHAPEPSTFNDDEPINLQSAAVENSHHGCAETVEIKTYPECSAVQQSASHEDFAVLIHLKAPHFGTSHGHGRNFDVGLAVPQKTRAPIDLVTVLDVSGSMAGTKIALLKRAMGFVIQNLGPLDRLSVIAFSSNARRLFHLRRMTDSGKQQAMQAVNSLVTGGGTNIAEGLRKGAKVMEDRKEKNPVCSIILLSDGQDTYTLSTRYRSSSQTLPDYETFIPFCISRNKVHQIPVHTFGFGVDHDSTTMHSISEISGGTFSFIESEVVIQDAFAQCIGGLLSVVVKEMQVMAECVHPEVKLAPIKSGSYANNLADDCRSVSITVGDLYADEEKDFLVSINVPPASQETVLLKVRCAYKDAASEEAVTLEDEVTVQRPEMVTTCERSIEVDRERNRLHTAQAMLDARAAADCGVLSKAVSILDMQRKRLSASVAGQSGDQLCLALDAELQVMQQRMASQQLYEASGRAYLLSGLSSHSWQRATARGDSTNSTSLVHAYQTPSMVDMLHRSRTFSASPGTPHLPIRSTRSFTARPQPR